MTKPVRFEDEASAELHDAVLRYETARLGTGTRLLADTDEAVARIAELPGIELENAIRVLAFAHTSRKPGYWFGRINEIARFPEGSDST